MKSTGKDEEKKGKPDEDGSDSDSDEPNDPTVEDEPKHWTAGDGDTESKPRSKKAAAREFIRCIDQSCAPWMGTHSNVSCAPEYLGVALELFTACHRVVWGQMGGVSQAKWIQHALLDDTHTIFST